MTYDDRETVCQKGKFRLEEWEDVNYCEHCFYNDDEPLGDGDVVLLLAKVTEENEELRQENKKILDIINNKIIEKGMNWYKAEDNSKEEKEANLQLCILEEVKEEIIKTMEE